MDENIVNKRLDRLIAIRWGSAPELNSMVFDHIYNYYEKVLPVWPEGRVKLFPDNGALIKPFLNQLSDTEAEQVNLMLQSIIKTAADSKFILTSMNLALIRLILTCAILLDKGDLVEEEDPSEALLLLFEEGYDLGSNHGALDVFHQVGFTSIPLPTRESIAQRVKS